eukprot:3438054-Amphidinium_carterae.1
MPFGGTTWIVTVTVDGDAPVADRSVHAATDSQLKRGRDSTPHVPRRRFDLLQRNVSMRWEAMAG